VQGLHKAWPPEVWVLGCARSLLIHDVSETNASIWIGKSHGATHPPVPEGPCVWPERLETETDLNEMLGEWQHEPEPKGGGDCQNRIDAAGLFHTRGIDCAGIEQTNVIQDAAASQRAVNAGKGPCGRVPVR